MPGLNPSQQDIDQFIAITQASPEDAQHFLVSGAGLEGAIEDFYVAQAAGDHPNALDEDEDDFEDADILDQALMTDQPEASDQAGQSSDGPKTLDGRPAEPMPEGWGSASKPKPKASSGGGIKTLFNTGLHAENSRRGPPPPSDEDSEDEGPARPGQDFFTGGEQSGLAVQNPDRPGQRGARGIVDNILQQAAQNGPNPLVQPSDGNTNKTFVGSGNVLGSEDTPSTTAGTSNAPPTSASAPRPGAAGPSVGLVSSSMMDDLIGSMVGRTRGGALPPPPPEEEEKPQTRHLTFWRNGFSIEDGPLMSYDEPQNKALLQAIQSGRAPPSVFNVRYNQPLQLEVAQRTNEDYRPPPKGPMKAFGGGGNRLGSPAPEVVSGTSTPTMPGGFRPSGILEGGSGFGSAAAPAQTSAPSTTSPASFAVDESKPTTSVQLRLGDGTRMVAKVNLTHTIGDLHNYVSAARPDSRRFVLQTTFPSKELSDDSETVESAKLQNAVVVQRFV